MDDLTNIPPAGDPGVADFAYKLFERARDERERLRRPEGWKANYALYRGILSRAVLSGARQLQRRVLANLYFANIERTVSNITARNPVGEVVDLDGGQDDLETAITNKLRKWWKETRQQHKTRTSARQMEIYGITVEKPYWDKKGGRPDVMPTDPFGFFPAPGNWTDFETKCPYICYAYAEMISKIEQTFDVEGVSEDSAYELLGGEREEMRPAVRYGMGPPARYETRMSVVQKTRIEGAKRCLVIEVWVRDGRTNQEMILDEAGEPVLDENGEPKIREVPVYPDGVRKITITKGSRGRIVLDDSPNPNLNPNLDTVMAETTYPWGRFPCFHANSYPDTISPWGFAAAEQVGDLILEINIILKRLVSYVKNVMAPPLIVQKHCGIKTSQIRSEWGKEGRLVLRPDIPNATIRFLEIPPLPSTFFNVLNLVVSFFDRVYQIEDADRGQAPRGVIAASAIVALQERNQLLMQTKTAAIDALAESRSRWAIGLWQNFGTKPETIKVSGMEVPFLGVALAGKRFNYLVEAGSTTPRTTLMTQELAKWLWNTHAIGQEGLLETLNWPNWKEEVERTAETQLDQALQILIKAGMPKEVALQLRQQLLLPQGGPGDRPQSGVETVKPGTPVGVQGRQPPVEVQGE